MFIGHLCRLRPRFSVFILLMCRNLLYILLVSHLLEVCIISNFSHLFFSNKWLCVSFLLVFLNFLFAISMSSSLIVVTFSSSAAA